MSDPYILYRGMSVELRYKRANPCIPVGTIVSHRRTSFIRAFTYGRFSRSRNEGNRVLPTTRSSSSCASASALGCKVMDRKKVFRPAADCKIVNHYSIQCRHFHTVSAPPANIVAAAYFISSCSNVSFPMPFSRKKGKKDGVALPCDFERYINEDHS